VSSEPRTRKLDSNELLKFLEQITAEGSDEQRALPFRDVRDVREPQGPGASHGSRSSQERATQEPRATPEPHATQERATHEPRVTHEPRATQERATHDSPTRMGSVVTRASYQPHQPLLRTAPSLPREPHHELLQRKASERATAFAAAELAASVASARKQVAVRMDKPAPTSLRAGKRPRALELTMIDAAGSSLNAARFLRPVGRRVAAAGGLLVLLMLFTLAAWRVDRQGPAKVARALPPSLPLLASAELPEAPTASPIQSGATRAELSATPGPTAGSASKQGQATERDPRAREELPVRRANEEPAQDAELEAKPASPSQAPRAGSASAATVAGAASETRSPPRALRGAVDLLLTGHTREALDSYRALTLGPEAPPALRELVRMLEHEQERCSAQGSSCFR